MTYIFLIQFGDWIAKIDNPYSMYTAIAFGVFWVLKYILDKPLPNEKNSIITTIISTLNKVITYCFWLAAFGLLTTLLLPFWDHVNLNSKFDRERAMIENVSGEYNGVIDSTSYSVKIDSVVEVKTVDKVTTYNFNFEIKPSNLIKSELGKGKIRAQRSNFWEGKDFEIDFTNSDNLKNKQGTIYTQEIGSSTTYTIQFNKKEDFLIKKLN